MRSRRIAGHAAATSTAFLPLLRCRRLGPSAILHVFANQITGLDRHVAATAAILADSRKPRLRPLCVCSQRGAYNVRFAPLLQGSQPAQCFGGPVIDRNRNGSHARSPWMVRQANHSVASAPGKASTAVRRPVTPTATPPRFHGTRLRLDQSTLCPNPSMASAGERRTRAPTSAARNLVSNVQRPIQICVQRTSPGVFTSCRNPYKWSPIVTVQLCSARNNGWALAGSGQNRIVVHNR